MGRQQRNTLILALVLLAALGLIFLAQQLWFSDTGTRAIVKVDGQVILELDLSRDLEHWVGNDEGRNLIQVADGAVRVTQADCPDLVCVHTGPIREEGEVIACLPHKLIVYIPRGEAAP